MLKMQVWDTAGKVEQRSIVRSYLRGTHIVLLVCDRQNPETLPDWLWSDLRADLNDQTVCWLVADSHGKLEEIADQAVSGLTQLLLEKHSLKVAGVTVFDFTDKVSFNLCLHDIFKHLMMTPRPSYNGVYLPAVAKKPAIYCYSNTIVGDNSDSTGSTTTTTTAKQLRVDIQLKGPLNIEIPVRDANSRWCCTVTDDQLLIGDQPYPYIYWDANWPSCQSDKGDVDTNDVIVNNSHYCTSSILRTTLTLVTSRYKQQFLMLAGD